MGLPKEQETAAVLNGELGCHFKMSKVSRVNIFKKNVEATVKTPWCDAKILFQASRDSLAEMIESLNQITALTVDEVDYFTQRENLNIVINSRKTGVVHVCISMCPSLCEEDNLTVAFDSDVTRLESFCEQAKSVFLA